ncbi:FAD-dependent oxidoreductase [Polluticoccus soli]|uniref:FAD-dependent oxidoreductase n=1 Tax=Polluticoccus soli TaxID=3034150 RepID=UPI0023E340A5|nr:FAD-dependent oxidoreductase [Flavipsychrobacter sp. JY13-12]
MKRDGALKSIWQENIPDYQSVNNWNKDEVFDVLIVGGGITGLTAGVLLQSEGKKCILAEAYNIGFGTTGGTTAHLNTILDTSYDSIEKDFGAEDAKMVASASREAIDLVEGLVTRYGIDCDFSYLPAYIYADTAEQSDRLDEIREASTRAGVVASCSEHIPVPMAFKNACRFDMQAQIHATKYLHGLAKAYETEGGVLIQHCIVGNVENGQHFTVDSSLGEIKAHKIIYATHIPPGINLLHFRCAPYRSYACAFTLKSGDYPAGLIYDMSDPYNYFRTQTINGRQYIVAGGFDHKTGHEANTEQVFRELEAYLRGHFDIDSIDYKWSSQYFNSADGLPYIGELPGAENIYVGTGYCGNGITFGSLAGKMICEMITGHESKYAELFDPSRIKIVAGFADFVKENADVISKFIGMRFDYEKVSALAELAPGEATLADWEDHKVALYKDENGRIHALDPVCPHAKCIVDWNSAEKSWDCPCHGSRFAYNGALLTGPARKGLTQVKWEDIEGD